MDSPAKPKIKPTVYLSKLADLSAHPEINFVVITDSSLRYDDGYGSSNNPSTSTLNYLSLMGLEDEESVKAWIRSNMDTKYSSVKEYKIFKVSPVQIMTEVSISVSMS
jgi:hypothetical protein